MPRGTPPGTPPKIGAPGRRIEDGASGRGGGGSAARIRLVATALVALALPACGGDAAHREYFAALRGEESGMTREEQIAHLDRAIELAPRRSEYFETRAIYRIDLRQFPAARADLDRDLELVDRPYAHFLRGLVACQAGEPARSLADFDAAIATQPANSQFYRGRSLARAAVGDSVGALADAEHLVTVAPQQGESFYARGVALARFGREREAIADFDRASGIRPELVYVIEARAEAYARAGDVIRAEAERRYAAEAREAHSGCAPCQDPFRY